MTEVNKQVFQTTFRSEKSFTTEMNDHMYCRTANVFNTWSDRVVVDNDHAGQRGMPLDIGL